MCHTYMFTHAPLELERGQLLLTSEHLHLSVRVAPDSEPAFFVHSWPHGTSQLYCIVFPLPALQELHGALKKVQAELAKYSHVNKKALDQYVNFTEQREELQRRVSEVDQSGETLGTS